MIAPCSIRSVGCDCLQDPARNFSAERPDIYEFIGMYDFADSGGGDKSEFGGDLLGDIFQQASCFAICYSTISQEDADLCALAQAQLCAMDQNSPVLDPDGKPVVIYGNHVASCRVRCSDRRVCQPGECLSDQTFTWTVAANTVYARTQVLADRLAQELACQQAKLQTICISTGTLVPCCINTPYHHQLTATGGTPWKFLDLPSSCSEDADAGDRGRFDSVRYLWSLVSGSLPNGLELRACTGIIKGTPTQGGTFTFTVQATDGTGAYQTKTLTLCVMEITTADPLPDANNGTPYSKQLLETPGAQGDEIWTIVDGALPSGLSLNADGLISGTPNDVADDYLLTVQVATEVCGQTISCRKDFTITIVTVPIPDPLSYWKMEEATGATRVDSLGLNNLSQSGSGTVTQVAGKIAFGAEFIPTGIANEPNLRKLNSATLAYDGNGFTVCGWFFMPSYDGWPRQLLPFRRFLFGGGEEMYLYVPADPFPGPAGDVPFTASFLDTVSGTEAITTDTFAFNTWHFFRLWYDPADQLLRLQINNGTKYVSPGMVPLSTGNNVTLTSGLPPGASGNTGSVDELGYWNQVLTDAQASALYNGGLGNTYPF